MNGEQIGKIRQCCEAALPGPWIARSVEDALIRPHCCQVLPRGGSYTIATPVHSNPVTMANIEFIAAARQDVPDLLDEVARLQDLAEAAWGLVANAWGGDWDLASEKSGWKAAAERWRERYHTLVLPSHSESLEAARL